MTCWLILPQALQSNHCRSSRAPPAWSQRPGHTLAAHTRDGAGSWSEGRPSHRRGSLGSASPGRSGGWCRCWPQRGCGGGCQATGSCSAANMMEYLHLPKCGYFCLYATWASSKPQIINRMLVQRPWVSSPSWQNRLARQSINRLSGRNSPIPMRPSSHWGNRHQLVSYNKQLTRLTSNIPSIQLSAIHPMGPPMLASPATGASKLASLILR